MREPALRVAMPRVSRRVAPGGSAGPGVARGKNREVSIPTAEEFARRLAPPARVDPDRRGDSLRLYADGEPWAPTPSRTPARGARPTAPVSGSEPRAGRPGDRSHDPLPGRGARPSPSGLGTPHRVIPVPPSPRAREPTRRAVGSPAFLARSLPGRRGRPRIGIVPSQNQGVKP